MYSPDTVDYGWIAVETDWGFTYRIRKPFVIAAGISCGTTVFRWFPTGNIGFGIIF